ncbi:hypothetical protein PYJP_00100 [Pyrofollis japonicus]|uniref:PPC domain-containing DNA-binding protein n=1 Tax=Pyrofollis japonicus TaxID=3060460 RepID=UPI00295B883E|nr:PPC domain-containing DNA-binding protein [Pyrofollis japonicus]BEP16658.1 hypothetical protein PYJP_00100 [Pyrofollis japonicus]
MEILKPLNNPKAFFVKIEEGEKLPEAVATAAKELDIGLAFVHCIGGFSHARIAVYEYTTSTYHYVNVKPLENHVLEVVALNGNIVCDKGDCRPHLHVAVARKPDEIYAGHLVEATVKPFIELFIIDAQAAPSEARRILSHRFTLKADIKPMEK